MKQFKRVMATLLCLVMTLGLFAGLTLPASAAVGPWVQKIPWRRAWQPTLVFLPGE